MKLNELANELLCAIEEIPHNTPAKTINDFSKGEVFLLNYLLISNGYALPGQMSEAMGTSTARIAAAVNSMERKGWVIRRKDMDDHRKTNVYITPKGAEYAKSCRESILESLKKLLLELGEQDAAEYLRITKRVASIAGQHNSQLFEGRKLL